MRPSVLLAPAVAALVVLAGCPASGCRYDTDCPGAEVCLQGKCLASPAVAVAAGGGCGSGIPCARGEVCVTGVCKPKGSLVTQPCTSSRDPNACPTGQICVVSNKTASCATPPCIALNACATPGGVVPPAHACQQDGDCQTGWCVSGACASVCAATSDCPSGYTCQNLTDTPPGASAPAMARICVPGSSSAVTCDADRYCPPAEGCLFVLGSSIYETCAAPAPGTSPTGGRCTGSSLQCASYVCLSDGFCSAPCLENTDCPVAMDCLTITFTGYPGQPQRQGCALPSNGCLDNAMCSATPGQICALAMSLDGRHALLQCTSATGAAAGASCTSGSDCASGLCGPSGVCTQPCVDDTDCRCAGGGSCKGTCGTAACTLTGWTCKTMQVSLPAGGTETARVCSP